MTNRSPLPAVLLVLAALLGMIQTGFLQAQSVSEKTSWLNEAERAWLREHPTIRLAPAPDFPPVEFFDGDGTYQGIAADYVREIEQMLGIRFETLQLDTWADVVRQTKNRQVDMWAEAAITPARESFMAFTRPYIELPAVIITRNEDINRTNMEELAGHKVAVVEGYAIYDWVAAKYPKIELIAVPNIEEGLQLVAYGQADAIIEANAPVIYYIERNGFTNLHVAGDSGFVWRLAMGVRSDWAPMRDILQKALDRIPATRKTEIFHKWVALKQYGWTPSTSLLLTFAAVFVMTLIAAVLAWNRSLKRVVEVRTQALEQKLKEVEQAQQESYRKEKSFNLLFNAVEMPLALHELNGDLIQLNERALEIFGLRSADLDQIKFPRDFSPSEMDMSDLAAIWERIVAGKTERFLWTALQPRSGHPLSFLVCCRRIDLGGRDGILSCLQLQGNGADQSASP